MDQEIQFHSAASYTLDALGEIFTCCFEGYFYAATVTAAMLSQRIRAENLDLQRSVVMHQGREPAGIALIGLRGERAWCGGFGVAAAARGQGLAHRLAAAMLDQARQAGVREFSLEVLTRNTPAIKTYLRAGMRVRRDLRLLEWRRDPSAALEQEQASARLVAWQPRRLLAEFDALHPVPAAWQRDLPALLVRAGMQSLAMVAGDRPVAYVLFQLNAEGRAQIADLGAERAEQARTLLAALQQRAQHFVSVNEPADSPLTPTFDELGSVESDRQHELVIDLAST
jgi:RimJ/RimL family protein N-acetyltransferase